MRRFPTSASPPRRCKMGSVARGERLVKYNRLLRIEQHLLEPSWRKDT